MTAHGGPEFNHLRDFAEFKRSRVEKHVQGGYPFRRCKGGPPELKNCFSRAIHTSPLLPGLGPWGNACHPFPEAVTCSLHGGAGKQALIKSLGIFSFLPKYGFFCTLLLNQRTLPALTVLGKPEAALSIRRDSGDCDMALGRLRCGIWDAPAESQRSDKSYLVGRRNNSECPGQLPACAHNGAVLAIPTARPARAHTAPRGCGSLPALLCMSNLTIISILWFTNTGRATRM